jgi:uncharacterized C2H2 Zn-finger protein
MQSEVLDLLLEYSNNSVVWSQCWDQYVQTTLSVQLNTMLNNEFDFCTSDMTSDTVVPKSAFRKMMFPTHRKAVFVCTVPRCGKTFTRRAENSKAHYLQHNQMSPFECEFCLVAFRRVSDLKRHVTNIHYQSQ